MGNHIGSVRNVLAIRCYRSSRPDRVNVPLRAIVADAIRLGSSALLLSHNHPGGDPTPSAADRSVTAMLARAAQLLGIRVHDHLIFGGGRCVSFRALGLL